MQLGTQQGVTSNTITSITNISHVYCGAAHSVIRTQSDTLYCCGYNGNSMTGRENPEEYIPLQELDFPLQNKKQRITDVIAAVYTTIIAIGTNSWKWFTIVDDHILVASSVVCGFKQRWVPHDTTYTWRYFDFLESFKSKVLSYQLHGKALYVLLANRQLVKCDNDMEQAVAIFPNTFLPTHLACNEQWYIFANSSEYTVEDYDKMHYPKDVHGNHLQLLACTKYQIVFIFALHSTWPQLLYKKRHAFADVIIL